MTNQNYNNNKKKLKLRTISIVYLTPKKQLWGIDSEGVKKCIMQKARDIDDLLDFVQNQKLITYKDSKLFKKGIELEFISKKIKLFGQNKSYIVKVLNSEDLKKEFLYLIENEKNKSLVLETKTTKNQCLGFKKDGTQCNRKISKKYCFQHTQNSNLPLFNNKSPLRYPGGKTRACKILFKILKEHFNLKSFQYIVSPFFGGGSFEIFLSNQYKYTVFANDLYYYVSNFWEVCKTNKKELVNLLEASSTIDKKTFLEYKKKLKSTNNKTLQAYYFFVLNRCSFNGVVESAGFSEAAARGRFTRSSINVILNLNLSKFMISNCDFEKFLKNHHKEGSLVYLDPPYFSNKTAKLYGNSGNLHVSFDHIRLFNYISTKSNWIMTYDNCSFIKNLYKDFKQIEVSWSYGMTRKKTELVILGKKK